MGTTATALQSSNAQFGYCLCIEGYPNLITDAADPTLVETAWAATLWTNAIPGLEIEGVIKQSLEPWGNELRIPQLSFRVLPTQAHGDVLGVDIFKGKATNRSELVVAFGPDEDAGTGFTAKARKATLFSAGAVVYAGNQALKLGTPSGQNLPVASDGQGYLAPFSTDTGASNRFPMAQSLSATVANNTDQVHARVLVTDSPETWVGRKVALHLHRISSGVWDTYAQSEVIFAGVIDSVGEDGDGAAVITCEGILRQLMEATIMERQFVAKPKEGYNFQTGQWFQVSVIQGTTSLYESAQMVCGTDFTAGYYTAEQIADEITNFLDQDATVGYGSTPNLRWSARTASTTTGAKFYIQASAGAAVAQKMSLIASDFSILNFLGFARDRVQSKGDYYYADNTGEYGTKFRLVADEPPYKHMPIGGHSTEKDFYQLEMDLEDADGEFFDHTSKLPSEARALTGSGETWSYFMMGDDILFLAEVSATDASGNPTTIRNIRTNVGAGLRNFSAEPIPGVRDDASSVKIKQVLFYCDKFSAACAKLFASIRGTATNHATYDALPGGAAIPWSLLGTNFLNSLYNLEEGDSAGAIAIVAEKPTRIWDILKPEFALRVAGPVWKSGGFQIAQLSLPNARTADDTLDLSTKSDDARSVATQSTEFYCTTLKVERDRDIVKDEYRNTDIIISQTGPEQHGFQKTKTIKARNSYAGAAGTGAAVEALTEQLAHKWMPIFSKPLKLWKVSLNHQKFLLAPGDQVTLTDQWLRNPSSGTRGITARACTVMSVSYSLGISSKTGYFGEATLLYTEEDRLFPMAPVAEHDNTYTSGLYTNGWDSTNKRLAIKNSEYGGSVTGNFAVSDTIRVIEVDPADPAAADTFTDVIAGIGTSPNYIDLTTGFGGGNPAFDGTKTYRIIYDDYTTCAAGANGAAQILYAFQSDGFDDGAGSYGDGLILDTIDPNILADENFTASPGSVDLTLLPARHAADYHADGEPFHPGLVRDCARMANNLVSYKSTPRASIFMQNTYIEGGLSGSYTLVWCFPFPIGFGRVPTGYIRYIYVSPMYYSTGGANSNCRITLSEFPPGGAQYEDCTFKGATQQTVFSTTSTSLQTPTAVGLKPIPARTLPGVTWVTVEISQFTGFKGLNECRLGPLEAV